MPETRRLILLLLATLAAPLLGAQELSRFSSSRGFSFMPPSGWIVASKDQTRILTTEIKTLLAKVGDLDLDRIAAVALNPTEDQFNESLNIVVSPGRIPIDEHGVEEKLGRMIQTQYAQAGFNVTSLRATRRTFGSHRCLLVESQLAMRGIDVRQWQIAIPGKKQTYIVTCTAGVSEFDSFQPLFSNVIASMEIDRGLSGVPGWVMNAFIGAAIGALYGLIKWLFSDKTKLIEENPNSKGATAASEE